MATHNPPPRLLRAQLQSLRTQTDTNWICVISDDCSDADHWTDLQAAVGGDPRFVVERTDRRLGFYRNFERVLGRVPPGTQLIALCDQDDVWYPDKLAVLRGAIGDAGLVYADLRLVDERGRVLRDTLWKGRANNHTDIAAMLVAGSVTGAAAMLTADVASRSLPFPDSPGVEFHDHWLSLVALASGSVAYVPRSLQDYVQHRGAVVGGTARIRLGTASRELARPREWRAAYFLGYLPGKIRARTLLERCGGDLTPGKRRALERYLACERSWTTLAWLLARPARALWGHNDTLASEWAIARGVIWRRAAGWLARRARWPDRLLLDCRYPDDPLWRQRRLQRWRSQL